MITWTDIGMAFFAGIKSFMAVSGFMVALLGVWARLWMAIDAWYRYLSAWNRSE